MSISPHGRSEYVAVPRRSATSWVTSQTTPVLRSADSMPMPGKNETAHTTIIGMTIAISPMKAVHSAARGPAIHTPTRRDAVGAASGSCTASTAATAPTASGAGDAWPGSVVGALTRPDSQTDGASRRIATHAGALSRG